MKNVQTLITEVSQLNNSLPSTVSKSDMERLMWIIKDTVEMNPKELLSDLIAAGIVGKSGERLSADSVKDIQYGLLRLFTDFALMFQKK